MKCSDKPCVVQKEMTLKEGVVDHRNLRNNMMIELNVNIVAESSMLQLLKDISQVVNKNTKLLR